MAGKNPSRSIRGTKYDYPALLNGEFNQITYRSRLFKRGQEEMAAKSILATARNQNWCVVARVVAHEKTGKPCVEVWGDRELDYDDLPPPEIEKELREAGYDVRRRRHIGES